MSVRRKSVKATKHLSKSIEFEWKSQGLFVCEVIGKNKETLQIHMKGRKEKTQLNEEATVLYVMEREKA